MTPKYRYLLIYGDGGHANALREIIGHHTITICGDEWKTSRHLSDKIVIGVGLVREHPKRTVLFNGMKEKGYSFPNVIHKSAQIEDSAKLGVGVQVFANAVISSNVVIGDNCIINSGAIISHDCVLGDNVHAAPGVVLGGDVVIGRDTLLGIGCTILPGIKICKNSFIRIGENVIANIGYRTFLRI